MIKTTYSRKLTPRFAAENEASFKVPVKRIIDLTAKFNTQSNARLLVISVAHITQMWIQQSEDKFMRTRLRTTVPHQSKAPAQRTLDTKFELVTDLPKGIEKHERYEFNQVLTDEEYWTLAERYVRSDSKAFIEKTRITARDIETNLVYTIDIYDDSDIASVEIEFEDPKDLFKYKKPDWAND